MTQTDRSLTERHLLVQRPRLVSLVSRVVGAEAEDVVQEAMLKLESDPVRHRPAIEVAAWLRRVAINLAFNRRRDTRRWHERTVRGGSLEPPVSRTIRKPSFSARRSRTRSGQCWTD